MARRCTRPVSSLKRGNTSEARRWYTRLLDADPKDTAVIALVTEIEASAEAAPVPTPQEIPGVDEDAGDQAIPFIADHEGAPIDQNASSAVMESTSSPAVESAPPGAAESAPLPPPATFETTAQSRPVEGDIPSEPTSTP